MAALDFVFDPTPRPAAIVTTPPAAMTEGRRPADVLAAGKAYALAGPNLEGLPLADAQRGQQLVHEAVSQLPDPKIQVNRCFDNALSILKTDAPMPTMFDLPENKRPYDYNQRKRTEDRFGLFGEGVDAGHTVYGSVQFADTLPAKKPRLNTGVDYYGPVSLVLKPEAWARATVMPGDSYEFDYVDQQPGAVENLADVAAERMYRTGNLGGGMRDAKTSVALLKSALTSSGLTGNEGMIEAQIRGASRDDIAEIRIKRNPFDEAGLPQQDRLIRQVRYHAGKLGIPVHQQTVR